MKSAGNHRTRREFVLLAALGAVLLSYILGSGVNQAVAQEVVTADKIQTKWTGPVSNSRLGERLSNVGDVNGDDRDDFVVTVRNAGAFQGAWVLFGPVTPAVVNNLTDLSPQDGYRILTPANVSNVMNIGDQNSDGIDDVAILGIGSITVVYGVSDPANDLPKCDPVGVPTTRCVTVSNPESVSGQRLGFALTTTGNPFGSTWRSGDFNGDEKAEILYQDSSAATVVVLANDLGATCDPAPGLCTVDIDALGAPQKVMIESPGVGTPIGLNGVASPGDVNGDGRDDILTSAGTDGSVQPALMVIYGQDWETSPQTTANLPANKGYTVPMPFSSAAVFPVAPGDVNGDGIDDIGVQSFALLPAQSQYYAVLFGQSGTPNVNLTTDPPAQGTGTQFLWDSALGLDGSGGNAMTLGDLNGDGGDEFMVGIPAATVNSASATGLVAILQSHVPNSPNVVEVSPTSTFSDAVILTGSAASQNFGANLASAGDINDDGVNDLAITAPRVAGPIPAGGTGTNIGMLALIPSSGYYGRATTGLASSIDTDSATLSGTATANGRESVAYIEYGSDEGYGSETAEQPIGKLKAAKFVEANVSGLTPNTEYHFRTVVENDADGVSYGPDRTFTTDKVPDVVIPPCDLDPTAPGCPKFCEKNPDVAGCLDKPGLGSLIASSNVSKVKRGKKAIVSAWITSTGTKAADGVKICLKGPAKLIKGSKCQTVGRLEPGSTARKKFKVTVKRKAKKGKKATLNLTASADGLANKTAKVKIAVR